MHIIKAIKYRFFFMLSLELLLLCVHGQTPNLTEKTTKEAPVLTGAQQSALYDPLIKGKRLGVVAHQCSRIGDLSLIEVLLAKGMHIRRIFSPEHGFTGTLPDGEPIAHGEELNTGIPIISLYGKYKKPLPEQMKDIDLMLFDLQDVGARFYTYLTTLHYIMEACAKENIPLVLLDRPNPNGHYIDGPVLKSPFRSFVGRHPVPIVYGMTIGEYARMILGENWLNTNGRSLKLTVIPMKNYNREKKITLPVPPSPNLPNEESIELYPSLCLFEVTNVSIGRGTPWPFQIYGAPYFKKDLYSFHFIPQPNAGSKEPPQKGKLCYGEELKNETSESRLQLKWLIQAYQNAKIAKESEKFFNSFFEKLVGTDLLRKQIEQGLSEEEIRASWQEDLEKFRKIREKYLIYL